MGKSETLLPPDSESRWLDPKLCRFYRHGADLCLTIADERTILRAKVLRLFPLTSPGKYFSVYDGSNKEVGMLRNIEDFDAESRAALEADLARRYFLPVICRIINCRERFESVEWEVETDRGITHFTTRLSRQEALQPAPGRYILVDVDGNRYDIPDCTRLDTRSRELLLRYL